MKFKKVVPRIRLKQVREGSIRFSTNQITCPKDVYRAVLPYYRGADREMLSVVCTDAQSVPTCFHVVSMGSLNTTRVRPADLFKAAILANSFALVVIHNHPSGTLDASPDDIEFTRNLQAACELVGLELLDHIIVTDDGFTSMRERGLL